MSYPEAVQYLESLINYEKIPAYPYKESLKLERIKDFLNIIGNPQEFLRCIHIAGTKGKGSTCVFITYILKQAGYKVGLYTSPHLSDFSERIRILNSKVKRPIFDGYPEAKVEFEGMISKHELTDLIGRLRPFIDKFNTESKYGPLSFFEVYTSLAFVYFRERKVDFAVLETGLGGRLDATNVVNPCVCAITPLSYEHTQKLGNSLKEIATEKAGIIKSSHQSIVITAPQEKEALEVIREKCKEVKVKLCEVNKDIFYEKTHKGFNVMGIFGEYPNLEIRLIGKHQIINATVAIGVIEALRLRNIDVGIDSIRGGLYNTIWPGRCEVVSQEPLVVLDGAQNVASATALKEAIKENFKYKKLILVLGVSCDKDIKGICKELYDLADTVILTKANSPRATEPQVLAGYFNGKDTQIASNVKEAKAKALRIAEKENLVLVCGSLFVVGEFRNDKIRYK